MANIRKIAAHYVFTLTGKPLPYGILVVDEQGTILDIIDTGGQLQESESLEFYNGILIPGFVNAHCHLELSHLQEKMPESTGMAGFIEHISQLRHSGEDVIINACYEQDKLMQEEGIVAVGDISNNSLSFETKAKSLIHYHTFVETYGLNTAKATEIINQANKVLQQALTLKLSASITPHAPYSMSEQLFALTVEAGNKAGIISIHNQESVDEMDFFASKRGGLVDWYTKVGMPYAEMVKNYQSPIERIAQQVANNTRLLLIHNTYTPEVDIDYINSKHKKNYWVLCPNSNLYIHQTLPPVNLFRNKECTIAIGTDSLSSNWQLSVLDELKTLSKHFPAIGLNELLTWACLNGAISIGKETILGSFEKNKTPGVVWINNINFKNLHITQQSVAKRIA